MAAEGVGAAGPAFSEAPGRHRIMTTLLPLAQESESSLGSEQLCWRPPALSLPGTQEGQAEARAGGRRGRPS